MKSKTGQSTELGNYPVVSGVTIALVTNCVNKVMLSMDTGEGEGEAFASCFTVDGRCEVKIMGKVYEGREELKALGLQLYTKFRPATHWEGNVVVEATGVDNEVTNRSYWKSIINGECVSYGTHYDVLVKVDGPEYKIKSRTITHTWVKPK